jgi:carbonic anhydrase
LLFASGDFGLANRFYAVMRRVDFLRRWSRPFEAWHPMRRGTLMRWRWRLRAPADIRSYFPTKTRTGGCDMHKLISGFHEFRHGYYAENREFFEHLASKQQKPIALFITCSDSRINPNLITQTEPGDLFLIRNAGNIVPPHGFAGGEAATIEYSVEVLGIRDIVVCGHSQCGAVQAMLAGDTVSHLPNVRTWCQHAEAARRIVHHKYRDLAPAELAAVAARLAADEMRIFGWYYDIGAGQVWQYDGSKRCFAPLNGDMLAMQPIPVLVAS